MIRTSAPPNRVSPHPPPWGGSCTETQMPPTGLPLGGGDTPSCTTPGTGRQMYNNMRFLFDKITEIYFFGLSQKNSVFFFASGSRKSQKNIIYLVFLENLSKEWGVEPKCFYDCWGESGRVAVMARISSKIQVIFVRQMIFAPQKCYGKIIRKKSTT